MANEAALRYRLAHPVDFTVEDTAGVEKGAFLRLDDPRVASGAGVLVGAKCAGIAAREKVAGDGHTQLSVFRKGTFDVHASGAVLLGAAVQMAEANDVMAAATGASGAQIIGSSLEAAADNETFQIELNIQ